MKKLGMKCVVVLKSANKVIGNQGGVSLSKSAKIIDVTKDGDCWSEFVPGARNFSIDCDGAFVKGDESLKIINEAYENGTPLEVVVYTWTEAVDESGNLACSSKEELEGEVIVSDFSNDSVYDSLVSCNITLQGKGLLKPTFHSVA